MFSYEEFCIEVLGVCNVGDENGRQVKEDGSVPASYVEGDEHDAETDKGKKLASSVDSHISISSDSERNFWMKIKACFTEPQSSISIHDSDMDKKFPCKLKTRNDPKNIDTYIYKGWYKFAEERHLDKGDLLNFSMVFPNASVLSVLVDKD
ncbi:hypothetical protein RYX36_018661 [Vicia faba]